MTVQHLFFDLDNTLWDHRKNAYLTLKDIFEKEKINALYGINFEDFHREYFTINENLWAQIRDGEITKEYLRKHRFYDSFLFFGIDDINLSTSFENQFLDEIIGHNELVTGTIETLTYLKNKGYELHILSNGFQEVTHRKCQMSGIAFFFSTITSADEISIRKPQAEIFQYALHKSDATIANSMMIGDDWIADVEGALAFGMPAIFLDCFNDGYHAENVKTVQSLLEIKNIL